MKRKLFSAILVVALSLSLFATAAYASNGYQSGDVPIGSSNEVLMVGTVMPSVMSVTMPTYVPFHVSRTIEGDNKVISPRITMTNNSSVPVNLDVVYTSVDLSKLPGTSWEPTRSPSVSSRRPSSTRCPPPWPRPCGSRPTPSRTLRL